MLTALVVLLYFFIVVLRFLAGLSKTGRKKKLLFILVF